MEDRQFEHLLREIVASRQHTDEAFARFGADLRAEMRQQGTDLRRELIAYVDASAVETRRHSAVVAEGLRGEIQHLAEGLAALDEKTDRRLEEFRAEMREGFAGTRALIRVSYQDLDLRLRRVEEAGR